MKKTAKLGNIRVTHSESCNFTLCTEPQILFRNGGWFWPIHFLSDLGCIQWARDL